MHTDADDDRREHAEQPRQPTHYETHRNGSYLGMDAEADVEYGDGTPEWLTEALQRGGRHDSWCAVRDSWQAARQSWETDAEDGA